MPLVLWRCLSCPYLGQAGVCAGCFPPADGAVQRPAGPCWKDCLSAEITTRGCGAHQGWNISSLHGKTHSQVDDAYSWKYSFSDKICVHLVLALNHQTTETLHIYACIHMFLLVENKMFTSVFSWLVSGWLWLSQWVLRGEPEVTKKLMSFAGKCLSQNVY